MERRRWLRLAGGSVGATCCNSFAGVGDCPNLLQCVPYGGQWMQKPTPGVPRFQGKVGPVVARVPVQALQPAQIALLRKAYGRMRSLWYHITGLGVQSKLHERWCAGFNANVHSTVPGWPGVFLAWHRGFLFFHERLLAWHLKEMGEINWRLVRIPYWDHDFQKEPSKGDPYWSPADVNNSLWVEGRKFQTISSEDWKGYERNRELGLCADSLSLAVDNLNYWHLVAHGSAVMPPLMPRFGRAAEDPIFYAWHSNVDRYWTGSVAGTGELNPANTFVYFDVWTWAQNPGRANAGWVSISVDDLRTTNQLGYGYADVPLCPLPVSVRLLSSNERIRPDGRYGLSIPLMIPPGAEELFLFLYSPRGGYREVPIINPVMDHPHHMELFVQASGSEMLLYRQDGSRWGIRSKDRGQLVRNIIHLKEVKVYSIE